MKNLQEKLMNRMFKKVDDVVIDMTTNSIGVKCEGSIYTAVKDEEGTYGLVENIFEEMSVKIPAFAQATTLENVKEGDLVLNASGKAFGWVIKKMPKTLEIIKTTGHITRVSPAKANLIGQGQQIMVVSSMFGENMQGSLPMLMALSDEESAMDKMIPMLMMSSMAQPQVEGNAPTIDPMMMAVMMSGDCDKDMMKMMMMSQMMGGQKPAGGINPMMMAMMLK